MIEKKVLNKHPFSKAKKRVHDKIRKLFASGNVIIMYMTSFLLTLSAVYVQRNVKNQNFVVSTDNP